MDGQDLSCIMTVLRGKFGGPILEKMGKEVRVVCFDLGGVILEIRHSWNEVCANLGLSAPAQGHPLTSFQPFVDYQAGSIDTDEYLAALGAWLGVSEARAKAAHQGILIGDYPGAQELVRALNASGAFTCCFSNTNDLHWPVLCDPARHPAIGALQRRLASHELGCAKPDPAAYKAVEGLLPANSGIVFFDDSTENVEAACQAGWDAYRIDPSNDPLRQLWERLDILELVDLQSIARRH